MLLIVSQVWEFRAWGTSVKGARAVLFPTRVFGPPSSIEIDQRPDKFRQGFIGVPATAGVGGGENKQQVSLLASSLPQLRGQQACFLYGVKGKGMSIGQAGGVA